MAVDRWGIGDSADSILGPYIFWWYAAYLCRVFYSLCDLNYKFKWFWMSKESSSSPSRRCGYSMQIGFITMRPFCMATLYRLVALQSKWRLLPRAPLQSPLRQSVSETQSQQSDLDIQNHSISFDRKQAIESLFLEKDKILWSQHTYPFQGTTFVHHHGDDGGSDFCPAAAWTCPLLYNFASLN